MNPANFPVLPPEIAANPGSILDWAMTKDGAEYFQKLNEALMPPSGGKMAAIMELKMGDKGSAAN